MRRDMRIARRTVEAGPCHIATPTFPRDVLASNIAGLIQLDRSFADDDLQRVLGPVA